MVLGYTRVSKGQDQDTRMQETAFVRRELSGSSPSRRLAGGGIVHSCTVSLISSVPRM